MAKQNKQDGYTQLVLGELGRPGYSPRRTKELARDLGIPKGEYSNFRDHLKSLLADGVVERSGGSRWVLPQPETRITGRLTITRSGPGFLQPDDNKLDDLFIPEYHLGAALNNDRVEAVIEKEEGHGLRHFGRVVRVLERGSPRIVAIVDKPGMARPEDPKNPYDYAIEEGGPAVPVGHKILLEVTVWPGEPGEPAGRILEVLGPAGAPDTETAAILASWDAPGPFPDEVKAEVRNLRRELTDDERACRLDLTQLKTFTIDPEDARDYDDALSLEVKPDGTMVVGVHIADVSHFVRPGSRLDEESRERSTSIYLPGRVIPMLPEELSNDLCSLRPDEDHLTKTVFLHYDASGQRTKFEIHRSIIHSRKRFTYPEVMRMIESETVAADFPDREISDAVLALHKLAQNLRQQRMDKGSIELHIPEFRVLMDEEGHAQDVVQVEHDQSHQLIEEFMLAANVALAEWCRDNGMPVLYRAHASPSEENVEELAEFLNACGYPFKPPLHRGKLNAVVEKARGKPEEHAINLAILRSFMQAIYAPDHEVGHFALNFPNYMHFTSPIRRYPDLHLHQMLDSVFGEKAHKLPKKLRKLPSKTGKALERLGVHTSGRERRAMKIEEAIKDFRRLELLSRREQREFLAVVTGVRKFGIFVEIENFFVEGLLPRWQVEKLGFSTREEAPGYAGQARSRTRGAGGRPRGFHLGQEVKIRITKIDLPARLCEMELVEVM